MNSQVVKLLLVVIGILLGVIAGLVATALSRANGDRWPTAISKGSVAFGGAITLYLLVEHELV